MDLQTELPREGDVQGRPAHVPYVHVGLHACVCVCVCVCVCEMMRPAPLSIDPNLTLFLQALTPTATHPLHNFCLMVISTNFLQHAQPCHKSRHLYHTPESVAVVTEDVEVG
jgi:hypothetical protein